MKEPLILDDNDVSREKYREIYYEFDVPEKIKFLQDILRKTGATFEEIYDIYDETEMVRFVELGFFDDLDELNEYVLEDGGFNELIDLLLYKNKFLDTDINVFRERFQVSEIIDIYPSIWRRALSISKADVLDNSFIVTINGEAPILENSYQHEKDIIGVKFNSHGKESSFEYTGDMDGSYMLDYRVVGHIKEFFVKNNIDQYVLHTESEAYDMYYILPTRSVEELDKYKEIAYPQ
jgi:hypothetical protein